MKTGLIKSTYIHSNNQRFEGKYYLNSNSYLSMVLEQAKGKTKSLEEYAYVFNPPVFKRQFCKKTPRSVQYFQSSDVPSSIEKSEVFVFKGQAESLNLLVKKGDILVTGFGTIGNTKLVSSYQDGTCFANNVCRVRANPDAFPGFIYAVLTSKYGYAQLNKNASGSVVRYIESPGIRKTLIPNFPVPFQQEVDNLIQQSAKLREQAADALEKAKKAVLSFINVHFEKEHYKTAKVSSKDILNSLQYRLDPPALIFDGVKTMEEVTNRIPFKKVGDLNAKVYRPGIFKRIYVANGIPYIKGSEIFLTNPFRRCEQLSRSRTPFIDEMTLREGQILMTCAGSVGDVKIITQEYEDKKAIGSQDIIRIESYDELYTREYLFVYFQVPFVYDYIQSMKYGSVIERIEPFHVESIPVIKPSKELSDEVTAIIKTYMDYTHRAFNAEEKAITMVEEEIEKWQSPTA